MNRLICISFGLFIFATWQNAIAIPHSLKSSRLYRRSSLYAEDLLFGEPVHIPDNELDPKQRPLVPSESKMDDFVLEPGGIDFGITSEIPPHEEHSSNHTEHDQHALHVASWQWDYVRTPFIYTAVVIVAGFCKIGFHHAEFLSSIFPESCMLIVLGTIVGTIVHFTHSRELLPQFTPKAFFLFLLPPIVLESAYSLHD
ncbi:Sodium/hydrogen exchanger 1, partial [Stegodyphus mimosarum]